MGRIEKAKKNLIFSLGNNLFTTLLTFATRTIFIYTLGLNYLGLNGLYTNILSLLAIAELGIGNAISFSLYKPLAEKNEDKIASYIILYKKAYFFIGVIISVVGIILVPFLHNFINFNGNVNINYQAIYILFLINTVLPYFLFTYKISLLYADQKNYIVSKFDIKFNFLNTVTQFLLLFFLKSYYLYLISQILFTTCKNYRLSKFVDKHYSFLKNKKNSNLNRIEIRTLVKNVYALSLTKISGVVYSSTDNLIISTFISTVTVGLYSNYTMITNMLKSIISSIFNSFTASVGNLNAESSVENLYINFKRLNFINFWIYGCCFICLDNLLNNFISVWVGENAIFDDITVFLISLLFLIPGMNNVINIFKDACGLYWQTKYRALATAIVNLLVSLLLVRYLKIQGIFIGTIVAYLTTIYVKDPQVVFNECFNISCFIYHKELISRFFLIFIVDFGVKIINPLFNVYFSGIILFFMKAIFTFSISNLIFIIFFFKTEEFKFFYLYLKNNLLKIIFKRS
ncbi:lipopolysaccharide biosynthesis protein [Faecalibacillus intestinalis]|uniref:lipopolysaccharide biosynthesis protein n=1 Tax=Faecalibacillus intestinalis TaxID=1982626 RepID=UPI0035219047